MTLGSKEHYEMMASFEKQNSDLRLDKEDKDLWKRGIFYQNGETNKLFKMFCSGYTFGRLNYLNQ